MTRRRGSRAERLRPQDAFFLHVDTPSVPQEVCGLALLDPTTADGTFDAEQVVRAITRRLDSLPQLRQRLDPSAGRCRRPRWIGAPEDDVASHVRAVSMPSPGGHAEIAATVQGLISQHLDLSRPPWAMYLLHEPNREATALLLKLHHTVADGLGVIDVASRLLDPIPGRRAAGDATVGGPERGEGKEAAGSKGRPGAGRLGPRKWDRSGSTETTLGRGLRTVRGLVALARAGTAPPNSLNGPVDEARSFDFTEFGLREVEFVRQALGGTQNDVVLTVVGAALNRVLTEEANEVRTLRAMVPISLRRGTDRGRAGNWTSAISVPLPIASMAPQERLRLISEAARRLKRSPQPLAASFVMQFVGTTLPSPVHARVSRAMYRGKWFNLIVSTLRGADRPLRLAGATVAMAYPVLPLAEDVGLTVGAMTWCGKLTFGFTSHPGTAPDAEALADAARDAFDELLETAGGLSRPRTGSANTETEPPSPD